MSENGEGDGSDKMEDEEEEDEKDEETNKEDIVRIMITSDNHLGLKESDRMLRDDSFITFKEVLKYAKSEKVDFMLTGGDLFHHNKPSRETLYRTTTLLRKYCLGSRPVALKIHSNQKTNFKSGFGHVNYMDPNYNISLPIFSIHGNHDDPTGEDSLSALDILAVNGLINYFGRTQLDPILVRPILMSKGKTKIALYGLGYVRDQRLYRAFQQKKVHFYRPQTDPDGWFYILVLHQNRNQHHTAKANIKEEWIPDFFSIVIWGHEHEQNIEPTSSLGRFRVIQPGSTVANTYVPEEAKEKKCGVLEVHKSGFRFFAKPLYSTRPLIHETVTLKDLVEERDKTETEVIKEAVAERVEEMIERATRLQRSEQHQRYIKQYDNLKLPLIRLRVDYSDGYSSLNPQRFGQQFVDNVANPTDMILFFRKKAYSGKKKKKKKGGETDLGLGDEALETAEGIEKFISKQLIDEGVDLQVLPQPSMWEAVRSYVNKEENKAISIAVKKAVGNATKSVWKESKKKTRPVIEPNEDDEEGEEQDDLISKATLLEQSDVVDLLQSYQDTVVVAEDFDDMQNKNLESAIKGEGDDDDEESDSDDLPPSPSRSGQESSDEGGRGRGRARKKRGRGRKKKAASTRGRGRGRKKKATTTTRKRRTTTTRKKKTTTTTRRRRSRRLEIVLSGSSGAEDNNEDFPNTPLPDDDFKPPSGDDDDDDDDDDAFNEPLGEDEDLPTPMAPPALDRRSRSGRKRRRTTTTVINVDDDDDDEEELQPRRKKRKLDDEDDDDDYDGGSRKKKKKKKKKKNKKKKKKKKKTLFMRISSEEEDEDEKDDESDDQANSQVSTRSRRYRK